jgi:AcrR family transcriptional regulator
MKMNVVQNKSGETAPSKTAARVGRDALRERALDAARAVLREEGLKALNARRLAADIGAAVGTLYNLFENFEEVILRLNLETLEELEAAFAARAVLPKDPCAATLAIARDYLDFTARHRNRWASVLEFKAVQPHGIMDDFRATISRLVAEVERAIAPLFPPGAETARRLAAAVLWTSLEGISALSAADNLRMVAPATAWTMTESLIVNYLAGLKQSGRA